MKVAELREIIADLPDALELTVVPNDSGGLTLFADNPACRIDLKQLIDALDGE